jgi:hypothetical protein
VVFKLLLFGALAVLILEGLSWVLAGLAARFFATPIPNRTAFFAEQTERLQRLATNQSVRARIHPVLGWEYGTGAVSDTERLNGQGLRAAHDYAPEAVAGETRLAVFGDSYAYCNEVTDAESWPGQIEAGWKAEVLNYGVGGYGADQAFLRFRGEGTRLKPSIVIMGFTSMMATRVVSLYRRFQDPRDGPWFKPRFVLQGDQLRLIPAPVASAADAERIIAAPARIIEFGRQDFWYTPAIFEHGLYRWSATYRLLACTGQSVWRRYFHRDRIFTGRTLNPRSEAFALLTHIFRDFAAAVRAAGAEPVALMLPPRGDVELYAGAGRLSYDTIRPEIERLGVRVIDPARALATSSDAVSDLFASGGHYSARGNAIVAAAVAEALQLRRR